VDLRRQVRQRSTARKRGIWTGDRPFFCLPAGACFKNLLTVDRFPRGLGKRPEHSPHDGLCGLQCEMEDNWKTRIRPSDAKASSSSLAARPDKPEPG